MGRRFAREREREREREGEGEAATKANELVVQTILKYIRCGTLRRGVPFSEEFSERHKQAGWSKEEEPPEM